MNTDIQQYHDAQDTDMRAICDTLYEQIHQSLPEAESKVWHGAPVWFIGGNPIVGYWVRKQNVQLLFWSGQSFDEPGLQPEGKFKAAEKRIDQLSDIDSAELSRWLEKAETIQWDYKNIVKHKGVLDRL